MNQYSGADWIEGSLKKNLSPLGREVADVLGGAFEGIYHISKAAWKTNWDDPYFIRVVIDRGLNLYDDDRLTTLVVLCHDRMLRLEINPCNFNHLELVFHQRNNRTGDLMRRIPKMEDHIAEIRARCGLEEK